MQALRTHIALLLLLCLTRTLLPEAWVLALHRHEHTTDEVAQAPAFRWQHHGKALLSSRHQHCQVENLYSVPFLLGAPVVVPTPLSRPCFALAAVPTVATAPWIARQPAQLRGPPVA